MSGHVFHPGHSELHGITVVVETNGSLTYVGRYDSEDERGVHMLDVGVHEALRRRLPGRVRSEERQVRDPEPITSVSWYPPTRSYRITANGML